MGRISNMPPEERFTRAFVGTVLVVSSFFVRGKWVALVLEILFLASEWNGFCLTCEVYRKFNNKQSIKT